MKRMRNKSLIDLENADSYLSSWGIERMQLNEAVLETGSLDFIIIRNYLVRSKVLFSICGLFFYSREKLKSLLRFGRKSRLSQLDVNEKIKVAIPGIPPMSICSN